MRALRGQGVDRDVATGDGTEAVAAGGLGKPHPTADQTTDNQTRELEAAATARGWSVVQSYADQAVSGAKGREKRPQLDAMLRDAVRRRFDVVMVWAVDRLGRSLPDLVSTMQELHGAKVDLSLLQQGINTTTPTGRAMFGMLGVFAEFERAIIQVRVHAGGPLRGSGP